MEYFAQTEGFLVLNSKFTYRHLRLLNYETARIVLMAIIMRSWSGRLVWMELYFFIHDASDNQKSLFQNISNWFMNWN